MEKGAIVQLVENRYKSQYGEFKISAKIGSLAVVTAGKKGRGKYLSIIWLDFSSSNQMDGQYVPAQFKVVGKMKKDLFAKLTQ